MEQQLSEDIESNLRGFQLQKIAGTGAVNSLDHASSTQNDRHNIFTTILKGFLARSIFHSAWRQVATTLNQCRPSRSQWTGDQAF